MYHPVPRRLFLISPLQCPEISICAAQSTFICFNDLCTLPRSCEVCVSNCWTFFLLKNSGYWHFFSVTYNCFYGDALFLSLTSEREPQLKPANIWPVGAENGTIYEAAKSNAPAAGRRMLSQALTQPPPEKREDECFWKKHSHTPS